jgi:hypothetical protein
MRALERPEFGHFSAGGIKAFFKKRCLLMKTKRAQKSF